MGNLDRFKKRRALQSYLRAEDANALPAEHVAAALGLALSVQGKHVELANGIRGTYKTVGLVWCHKDGITGIGDNCALVMEVAQVQFRAALELLLGYAAERPAICALAATKSKVLRIPDASAEAEQGGREYLRGRGVSDTALAAAEACGMLRYIEGAVLYVGYDGGQVKSATRRGYTLDDPTPKRDLAGSDKAWPAIVPGSPDEIWVVEGGTDALALFTLHPADPPTAIVSGGAGNRAWLKQPHIVALLKRARRVTVARERETTDAVQTRIDAQHQAQADIIRGYCADVVMWSPPPGVKDLGEMLVSTVTPHERRTST